MSPGIDILERHVNEAKDVASQLDEENQNLFQGIFMVGQLIGNTMSL